MSTLPLNFLESMKFICNKRYDAIRKITIKTFSPEHQWEEFWVA